VTDLKKVLVIMGSPRKGNTYDACEQIRTELEKRVEVEFEYLWLKDVNLQSCRGCFNCFLVGESACPNQDDAPMIRQKMLDADCIIFAVPVYVMNVTGLMKTFMDRFGYMGHRPPFFNTKALILVNTAAGGLKSVMKYLNKIMRVWGFEVVGNVGLLAPPDPKSENPSRLASGSDAALTKAAAVIAGALDDRHIRKSPALYEIGFFHVWRAMPAQLEKYYPYDYRYWQEKGWFAPGLRYYVNIPVNPIYVFIARAAGVLMKHIKAG
jgi:multimeric flavodoxin WrbA